MEFQIVLPCGGCINLCLKSKELKGRLLIQQLYRHLQIAEGTRDYFGLCYMDKEDGGKNWIHLEDNLKALSSLTVGGQMQLQFEVRIFPKDPDLIFPSAQSRRIFRQHMKNLLNRNQIGCDNKTSAMLDAFIVQAEIGNYQDGDKDYFKKISDIEIYAPTFLTSGTPISETKYLKMIRVYHKNLNGMSPEQADILYLSLVQRIPMYGFSFYHISDSVNGEHFLALSSDGIHLIYESCLEKFVTPSPKEAIKWRDLIFCEVERKKVKLGFMVSLSSDIKEKSFKIKNRYTHKGAARFKADLDKYKVMFIDETVDGHGVFNSRKEAAMCYSTQLPRRAHSLGDRISAFRSSIKSKGKMRVSSAKEKGTDYGIVKDLT